MSVTYTVVHRMRWPQCRWVDNGYRIGGDLRDRRFGFNFIPSSKYWSEVARALKHDPGLHTIHDPTRLLRVVRAAGARGRSQSGTLLATPRAMGNNWAMAIPSPATQTDREVLPGIVERATSHSVDTGFRILRVKARGHRDPATIVGDAATISAGEWITASGDWVNDCMHSQQFEVCLPSGAPSGTQTIGWKSVAAIDPLPTF
jgi:hypothetical protein